MTSTSTDETAGILTRLDIDASAPAFSRALAPLNAAAGKQLDKAGVEPGLRELVRLRASQLNGRAYCVAVHSRDALAAGEPVGRVAVWHESLFFTARERAALALTDTTTCLADTRVPDEDWREVSAHLSPAELGALVALILVINAWSTVGVTARAWTPPSEPV